MFLIPTIKYHMPMIGVTQTSTAAMVSPACTGFSFLDKAKVPAIGGICIELIPS